MKKLLLSLIAGCLFFVSSTFAQLPPSVLVGYWHTWNTASAPFFPLRDVDSRYNVINIAFAVSWDGTGTDLIVPFTNEGSYTRSNLVDDVALVQSRGKKVLLSIGGATGSFKLSSDADRDTFIQRTKNLILEFGVDGIDIDIEQQQFVCDGNPNSKIISTVANPQGSILRMIQAIDSLLDWYQEQFDRKMILTMAPETIYVNGALSVWAVNNACGGAYLPIIHALEDDIDLLMVQLYNSGSLFDLDGVIHEQGDEDFIISATEAIIRGFTGVGGVGTHSGIAANKIAVALPSCGSSFPGISVIENAVNYLRVPINQPGDYQLKQPGYPTIRAMMTWSINNDAASCGGGVYKFAGAYQNTIGNVLAVNDVEKENMITSYYPNPATETITVNLVDNGVVNNLQIISLTGSVIQEWNGLGVNPTINVSEVPEGIYLLKANELTPSRLVIE